MTTGIVFLAIAAVFLIGAAVEYLEGDRRDIVLPLLVGFIAFGVFGGVIIDLTLKQRNPEIKLDISDDYSEGYQEGYHKAVDDLEGIYNVNYTDSEK